MTSDIIGLPTLLNALTLGYAGEEERVDSCMAHVFTPDTSEAPHGFAQDEEPASQDDSSERIEA